jgi:hypothetical protein
MTSITETLKVGDTVRVLNIETNREHRGVVAALWPKERAISVDVRKGKRVYFRSACSDAWYLPDMDAKPAPQHEVIDLF